MMRIHWFSITIFDKKENRLNIWNEYFSFLGVLTPVGYGGRSYRERDEGLLGAKVYYDPTQLGKGESEHYHIEIPGQACDVVVPSSFAGLLVELKEKGVRFKVKRLDLAFDDVLFTPLEFYEAVIAEELTSLVKRETLEKHEQPFEMSEDGSHLGTSSVSIGDRSSQRMVRVYDRRGPVRLEFQMRDERAHEVALDIFSKKYQDWEITAKSHLRQYIDFPNMDWWRLFVSMVVRADLKIPSARVMSLARMEEWFNRQVVVALSVYEDAWGVEEGRRRLRKLVTKARASRDRTRYLSILQLSG